MSLTWLHRQKAPRPEQEPYLPQEVIAIRFALEAQLIARNIHVGVAIAVVKQAMDEFHGERPGEATMTALRDRVHELGTERRNGPRP